MDTAQISSPTIFGGHFQELAQCVVLNAGTRPVTVSSVKIVDDTGQTRSTQTCSGPLDAGEFGQIVDQLGGTGWCSGACAPSGAPGRGWSTS